MRVGDRLDVDERREAPQEAPRPLGDVARDEDEARLRAARRPQALEERQGAGRVAVVRDDRRVGLLLRRWRRRPLGLVTPMGSSPQLGLSCQKVGALVKILKIPLVKRKHFLVDQSASVFQGVVAGCVEWMYAFAERVNVSLIVRNCSTIKHVGFRSSSSSDDVGYVK